jgi:anti-sigma regulatory factor (Ser/Thr protein kinase)
LPVVVMDFPPEAEAVAGVRELVCRVAEVDLEHPAVLVASELATNAILHAATPYRVSMHTNDVIRIEVSDESPEPPALAPSPDRGWGLQLVDKLSAVWGASPFNGYWKVVWAEVPRSGDWPVPEYQ